MSKREILKKLEIISNIFIYFFSIFPLPIKNFIYACVDYIPGLVGTYLRYILFKAISPRSGTNIYIAKHVYLKNKHNIIIGNNVSIHEMSYMDGYGDINIGDNVSISHNVSIISFDHTYQDINTPIKYNPSIAKKIIINDDIWIGAGSRILGGVTIHKRSIIAAGSVVTKEVDSHSIYAGTPAKKIKNI
jgi:acetyltransferase-like isoleucine patch superfamily enzyme